MRTTHTRIDMPMSRYRPPQPKGSPYITAAGFKALQDETKALWERRAQVTQALAAAAAEGDRSENAEYIYRKKELRELDRRIRYLQKRLPELTVVREAPADRQRIFFGAWIDLEDDDGGAHTYRIVGPDETDAERGYISMDAPLARALMKKTIDDEVTALTPGERKHYFITDVRYDHAE